MALPRAKLGVSLFRHPCRKPLSPVKGCVCLVGFASCKALVHTRPASVPGLNVGLPPSPSKDACSQSHTVAARRSDTNDWQPALGLRPKQGRFGCLPKVLHDAKPTKQATLDTPFSENTKVYRQTEIRTSKRGAYCFIFTFTLPLSSASVFLLHRSAAL